MKAAWVVGGGGLIGKSLVSALRARGCYLFVPPFASWAWQDEESFNKQVKDAVKSFARFADACGSWSIYWAAGVSGMSSSEQVLTAESRRLEIFIKEVTECSSLLALPGAVALVSSAGGIYAGSRSAVVNEQTPEAPTTAYGVGKLRQESLLRQGTLASAGCRTLVARVSTVYGPAQAGGLRQGLISHLARCVVMNKPAKIFVPLDTVRDYVYADDAAQVIMRSLEACAEPGSRTMKIVASERPTTIADIMATFCRLSRRALRFTTGLSASSGLYDWRSRFRSMVLPEQSRLATTTLLLGASQVLQAQRAAVTCKLSPET
jgi:UDP-glucose 4-epimerase